LGATGVAALKGTPGKDTVTLTVSGSARYSSTTTRYLCPGTGVSTLTYSAVPADAPQWPTSPYFASRT
jgi:hypothetical protein